MSLEILQERSQIVSARRELVARNASAVDSRLMIFLRRFGIAGRVAVGDKLKSWDVLSVLKYLENNVARDEPILDIGCYASEIIVALHKVGYSRLVGADLNPYVYRMPFQNSIRYEVSDFMSLKIEDASFRAITAISVIEHGFQAHKLLGEISRLLKQGGYFIASFDYWPEKVDTTGLKIFGMEWMIFSKADVEGFVNEASKYALYPTGKMHFAAKEKVIDWGGRQYTLATLVLVKGG
ncbi:class I SAM-dependent methyltransferase [Candidatus Bipolaricaulota bacterium]